MAEDLLRKLALLQARMMPQVGQTIGMAAGGPAGAAIGGTAASALGSGLEALATPQPNPLEGGMMVPQDGGGIMNVQSQASPWENVPGAMGQDLGYNLVSQGMNAGMGKAMGQNTQPGGLGSDSWIKILSEVLSKVPHDEIKQWLEQRSQSQVEG